MSRAPVPLVKDKDMDEFIRSVYLISKIPDRIFKVCSDWGNWGNTLEAERKGLATKVLLADQGGNWYSVCLTEAGDQYAKLLLI